MWLIPPDEIFVVKSLLAREAHDLCDDSRFRFSVRRDEIISLGGLYWLPVLSSAVSYISSFHSSAKCYKMRLAFAIR